MRTPLSVGIVFLSASLASQTPSPSPADSALHTRLSARLRPPALAAVESLIARGAEEGLPVEPMVAKALEGAAKGVAPERIAAAVRLERAALRDAQLLILHAGAAPPVTGPEIGMVAHALRRGVPPSLIEALISAHGDGPRGPALHAVADLMAQGIGPDDSYFLIIDALRGGVRGEKLFDVAHAVTRELEQGRSAADALARVRATLPAASPRARP